MARYAGLLLTPAEGFSRGFFGPSGKKREIIMLFWLILGNFGFPVVTKKIQNESKNSKKIKNNSKVKKNQQKSKKFKKKSKKSKNA